MAHVVLSGSLAQIAGESELDVDAADVRQLMRGLAERFPALAPHLEDGLAVAIDGEIHQDAWFSSIGPDSEVYLLPRIAGG